MGRQAKGIQTVRRDGNTKICTGNLPWRGVARSCRLMTRLGIVPGSRITRLFDCLHGRLRIWLSLSLSLCFPLPCALYKLKHVYMPRELSSARYDFNGDYNNSWYTLFRRDDQTDPQAYHGFNVSFRDVHAVDSGGWRSQMRATIVWLRN